MKRICFSFLLLFCLSLQARDYRLEYTLSFDTAAHYINVRLNFIPRQPLGKEPVLFKMPVWAPGYYVIVDFPKYLTDFHASSANGVSTTWRKEGKNGWIVNAQGADTLQLSYRIYANARSVAECRVERNLAFVAPNGVFMYVDGDINHAADIRFLMPEGWKNISTGLPRVGTNTFCSETFDQLYDCPLLLGNHYTLRFEHEGHPYEFALETPDGFEESSMLNDFCRMVSATTRLMGDVPYSNYCLIHLGQGGGGLEHSNSQACYTEGTFRFPSREEYLNYMGFVTHEYFHLYNVKSIRPIELGPFDYDCEVFTPMLWVSEGFTVYYETQLMLRAGIVDSNFLLNELGGYIRNIETTTGQQHMSLRQSSYDIWLNFFNRAENGPDVRISYYIKGPVIGLMFDALLRSQTKGERSLDDLMRLLYRRYFRELGRGFTEEEFWQCVKEVAGSNGHDVALRLRRMVDTTESIGYDSLLAPVGLQVDHQSWTLSLMDSPSASALRLRKAMLGV